MHIGIDARELVGQRTGVGRYLENLCVEWLKLPPPTPHTFTLYGPASGNISSALGRPFDSDPAEHFHYQSLPGPGGTLWEQFNLASAINRNPPDVLFAPAYSCPLQIRIPVVLTIHDISFATHPEWFSWKEGLRRRWITRQSATRAARVIAVSHFTKSELIANFGLPSEQVSVIWSGVNPPLQYETVPPRPLILYVGSIFNRRHIPELVRAFSRVSRRIPSAQLVLVGDNRSHPHQDPIQLAKAAGVSDRVTVKSYISEAELTALYSQAMVFVFLSEYEGFGLPPLEAMAAGIPTVVGDTPVARELYHSASRLVPVNDIPTIANHLITLLENSQTRVALLKASKALLDRFTWHRAASETLALLEQAGSL